MKPRLTGLIELDIQSQTAAGTRSLKKVSISAGQFTLLSPPADVKKYNRAAYVYAANITDDIELVAQTNAMWTLSELGELVSAYAETTISTTVGPKRNRPSYLVPVIIINTINVFFED